jgi:hypothetical protein
MFISVFNYLIYLFIFYYYYYLSFIIIYFFYLIFIFIFMFALSTIAGNSKHLPHGPTTPLGCPLPPLSSSQTTPAGHQPITISLFLGSTPIREPPSSVRGFQLPSSHSINQPNCTSISNSVYNRTTTKSPPCSLSSSHQLLLLSTPIQISDLTSHSIIPSIPNQSQTHSNLTTLQPSIHK